ncbi:RNA-binding protein, putative [Babesia microti strain RI]|uniref:RNA-binding protein, putative n=1 Tax=Babesia microti (strain RI) TaxID=1133968 RepID=A0A1R4AC45_BABMR|nr:RNA-binding protein, putative [Babesia microti strain RI]SJK86515.1 RNA-binding protein, putative [Babesia microti strain RI]|eukprot:XP_012649190.2 RNA-binding protein, putative [Babesia microti strain RI]
MTFSECVTLLFFIDVVTTFRVNISKCYDLSHIAEVYVGLGRVWDHKDEKRTKRDFKGGVWNPRDNIKVNRDLKGEVWDTQDEKKVKRDLKGFVASICPFRLPDAVVDIWYRKLLDSGLNLQDLYRVIPYCDPSDYQFHDSANMLPPPFERSKLDNIMPLIGSNDKKELNKKYEKAMDKLEPEYLLTECLISAIREIYDVIPERKLSYDEEWERYEEGIREGFIDQNLAENYYLPTPDGQLPKLRGLERYYRERVKAGADPAKEAENILTAMKKLGNSSEFKFEFDALPKWTKDISLAVVKYFAQKTNDSRFLDMLMEMGKETQNIRAREEREFELGNQYAKYCFAQRKRTDGTGPHKPSKPFWFWRDVVTQVSPSAESTIKEIVSQIKRTDPTIDTDELTRGTFEPVYPSSNPTTEEIVQFEMIKAIKSSKQGKFSSVNTNAEGEEMGDCVGPYNNKATTCDIKELLPGFNPPVHIANYFKDCLSQQKFDEELKKFNLEHFGSEEYKIYLGQIVKGTISMVETQTAYVDISAHLTAKLPIQEVFDDPKTIPLGGLNKLFKEGDVLHFEIIEIWPNEIKLSLLSLRELYKLKSVLECHSQNKPMLFTVKDYYSKGLYGEVLGYRAFIPKTQLGFDYQDSIRLYRPGLEGTKIPVMYLDYSYNDKVVIVSNCKAIEYEQVKFIRVGDILRCRPYQISKYGLILKALNVHCVMSPYEMSPTHFEQYQKGFLCTNEIFAQVIDVGQVSVTTDGDMLVALSSRRELDGEIIPSPVPNEFITTDRQRRGINEFVKDWKRFQLGNKFLPHQYQPPPQVKYETPAGGLDEESLAHTANECEPQHLVTGQYSLLTKTPNSVDALDKIFNDKADGEGEIGVLMDLDDEEYVKSDNVFKEGTYENMMWFLETMEGCVELSSAEQRFITNAYNQNDQVIRYSIRGKKIVVDLEENIYYNCEDETKFKIFSRDLQQRLKR